MMEFLSVQVLLVTPNQALTAHSMIPRETSPPKITLENIGGVLHPVYGHCVKSIYPECTLTEFPLICQATTFLGKLPSNVLPQTGKIFLERRANKYVQVTSPTLPELSRTLASRFPKKKTWGLRNPESNHQDLGEWSTLRIESRLLQRAKS